MVVPTPTEPEGAPEDIDIWDVAHDAFNAMAFVILQRGCGDAQKMWYNIELSYHQFDELHMPWLRTPLQRRGQTTIAREKLHGCEKSFESERNLRRHYRRHVYIHEECRYCSKPLKNVSQVHTHPANCPDRNGAKLTNEEFDTRQWLINHSNNRLDEERQLVRQSLKRTREEKEEGGGGDNKRGVSKAKRGGSDNTCGESGGSGCEGSLPTLPHSDNLRPEQMPSGDNTAWQNAVSQEIQCSSTDKNVAAAQQEAFSYRQNPLLDNGPTGGPTVITPRREATSSHNIDKISHPCPWNDTEVTAQVPSTTYGTYTEEREQQSNNWAPGVVQVPTPTNYSLVEDDNIYMQAPSLFSHPFDQFIIADMLGTQHNDEITTANSLPLDEFLGYGTQHHPP
ncbi:hypothetical protein FOC1_g10001119 [Fusarium oxysporum f. sp. cubense race 1]|uniref:Uncharacterized protein n=1 Tax=Fusarium oxysporum f. sp. cubense (strain race 1) TaxID=1229664 RepID=N4U3M9_FUSC1|nr:hypothetical protein FOC1_g10001119 [Fusarium oxysporum f. sp. cubense race 1]